MDFTDEQILYAVQRYNKDKEYKRNYYNKKYHEDEDFRNKMKDYSRTYYQNNKEKRKDNYEANKDRIKAHRKYNYYKKSDSLSVYKEKYPDEFNKYFMQNSM